MADPQQPSQQAHAASMSATTIRIVLKMTPPGSGTLRE
jgi:hypothetical protein